MAKAPRVKIQWTNKFSNETGYVKALNKKEKYFENTFDIADAMEFVGTTNSINKNIALLEAYCSDNTYAVVK